MFRLCSETNTTGVVSLTSEFGMEIRYFLTTMAVFKNSRKLDFKKVFNLQKKLLLRLNHIPYRLVSQPMQGLYDYPVYLQLLLGK